MRPAKSCSETALELPGNKPFDFPCTYSDTLRERRLPRPIPREAAAAKWTQCAQGTQSRTRRPMIGAGGD